MANTFDGSGSGSDDTSGDYDWLNDDGTVDTSDDTSSDSTSDYDDNFYDRDLYPNQDSDSTDDTSTDTTTSTGGSGLQDDVDLYPNEGDTSSDSTDSTDSTDSSSDTDYYQDRYGSGATENAPSGDDSSSDDTTTSYAESQAERYTTLDTYINEDRRGLFLQESRSSLDESDADEESDQTRVETNQGDITVNTGMFAPDNTPGGGESPDFENPIPDNWLGLDPGIGDEDAQTAPDRPEGYSPGELADFAQQRFVAGLANPGTAGGAESESLANQAAQNLEDLTYDIINEDSEGVDQGVRDVISGPSLSERVNRRVRFLGEGNEAEDRYNALAGLGEGAITTLDPNQDADFSGFWDEYWDEQEMTREEWQEYRQQADEEGALSAIGAETEFVWDVAADNPIVSVQNLGAGTAQFIAGSEDRDQLGDQVQGLGETFAGIENAMFEDTSYFRENADHDGPFAAEDLANFFVEDPLWGAGGGLLSVDARSGEEQDRASGLQVLETAFFLGGGEAASLIRHSRQGGSRLGDVASRIDVPTDSIMAHGSSLDELVNLANRNVDDIDDITRGATDFTDLRSSIDQRLPESLRSNMDEGPSAPDSSWEDYPTSIDDLTGTDPGTAPSAGDDGIDIIDGGGGGFLDLDGVDEITGPGSGSDDVAPRVPDDVSSGDRFSELDDYIPSQSSYDEADLPGDNLGSEWSRILDDTNPSWTDDSSSVWDNVEDTIGEGPRVPNVGDEGGSTLDDIQSQLDDYYAGLTDDTTPGSSIWDDTPGGSGDDAASGGDDAASGGDDAAGAGDDTGGVADDVRGTFDDIQTRIDEGLQTLEDGLTPRGIWNAMSNRPFLTTFGGIGLGAGILNAMPDEAETADGAFMFKQKEFQQGGYMYRIEKPRETVLGYAVVVDVDQQGNVYVVDGEGDTRQATLSETGFAEAQQRAAEQLHAEEQSQQDLTTRLSDSGIPPVNWAASTVEALGGGE